jgi:hypothetical protein
LVIFFQMFYIFSTINKILFTNKAENHFNKNIYDLSNVKLIVKNLKTVTKSSILNYE